MIVIELSTENIAYAERIEACAEMCVILKNPKSFSSEELQLLQIGVTLAVPFIAGVVDIFVEMWKEKRGYSITSGKDVFICSTFTKEELLKLAEMFAPCYLKVAKNDEELFRKALTAFLEKYSIQENNKNAQ